MLERVKDLFARVEPVEGVYTDPLDPSYHVIAFDLEASEEHEEIPRDTSGSSLSKRKSLIGRSTTKVTFGMDLKGAGASGGVPLEPAWGRLLQACGMRLDRLSRVLTENWLAALPAGALIGNHASAPTATGLALGSYAVADAPTKVVFLPITGAFAGSDPLYFTDNGWVTSTKVADVTAAGAAGPDGRSYRPFSKVRYTVATTAAGWTTGATTTVGEIVKGVKAGSPDAWALVLAGSGLATGTAQTLLLEPILGRIVSGMVLTGQTHADTATTAADAAPQDNWTLSMAVVLDGMAIKVRGCRGTWKLVLNAGQPARIEFEFTGLSEGEADFVSLSGGTSDPGAPLRFHEAEFSVEGIPFRTEQLELDGATSPVIRTDANQTEGGQDVMVSDRDPKGSINPEFVPPGTFDWRSKIKNAEPVAIKTRMGTPEAGIGRTGQVVGSAVWVDIPKAQVLSAPRESRDGILVGNISFACRTESIEGDDELEIVSL